MFVIKILNEKDTKLEISVKIFQTNQVLIWIFYQVMGTKIKHSQLYENTKY